MENYTQTMLVKLGMPVEGATGLSVRTPIHKPIEDMRNISDAQVAVFVSAAGMSGLLASRITQNMSALKWSALAAVVHTVKYCASTMTACLFQPYGSESKWRLTTGSDHAGNFEPQNKQYSQLAHMAMRGRAPMDLGGKATAVQTVSWPDGDGLWNTAELPAEPLMLTS